MTFFMCIVHTSMPSIFGICIQKSSIENARNQKFTIGSFLVFQMNDEKTSSRTDKDLSVATEDL